MSNLKSNLDFQTTCWSQIRQATLLGDASRDSLEQLCRQYWYPLYAFLRRSGHSPDAAQEYVQSFFGDLLSRDSLKEADPGRGRFRSFLLTACKHHVANQKRRERALKRGGSVSTFSLSSSDGEARYGAEPVDGWTAEKLFDRQWALAIIDAAFQRIRDEYSAKGREQRFDLLKPLVAPAGETPAHAEVARSLGCSTGAVKVATHRLRQQYARALREEIAQTIDGSSEEELNTQVNEELNLLLTALRGE